MVPHIAILSLDWHWYTFLSLLVVFFSDRSLGHLLHASKEKINNMIKIKNLFRVLGKNGMTKYEK